MPLPVFPQGWRLHHLPRQPSPVYYHFSYEEFPPNDQPEPPLEQLETVRGSLQGFHDPLHPYKQIKGSDTEDSDVTLLGDKGSKRKFLLLAPTPALEKAFLSFSKILKLSVHRDSLTLSQETTPEICLIQYLHQQSAAGLGSKVRPQTHTSLYHFLPRTLPSLQHRQFLHRDLYSFLP